MREATSTGRFGRLVIAWMVTGACVLLQATTNQRVDAETFEVIAVGHDSRIDLRWDRPAPEDRVTYRVYRAAQANGLFQRLGPSPHENHVYSDFIGRNHETLFYRVHCVRDGREVGARSPVVSATTRPMDDGQLMTSVQEATFRYFWDHAHPISGLAFERGRTGKRPDIRHRPACTSGGTGFGLMALAVGAERGFVSRADAARRTVTIVTFLQEKADRIHGAWPHWFDGTSGKTIPFSRYDDGADLVETSYLVQGLLTVRQVFRS